ncbi:MAG: c-type cytochrome [Gemmatimonadota bacterium]|jgi:nitric oxide reductase subunit C
MTRRQAGVFFVGATAVFTALFVGLTIDSHGRFPALTGEDRIDARVLAGKDVWHEKNCVNCHTLLGEGAYYAPDLTKISQQRGPAYLTAFLREPSRFYSEEEVGRLMPSPRISDGEIDELIAFLDWIAQISNQGWPPRPILVSGSALPGAYDRGVRPPSAASEDPVEIGEALFHATPPACYTCHSLALDVVLAGPSLAGMAGTAARRVEDPAYGGDATDAASYVRESILAPDAYVVPGETFSAAGSSIMPGAYAESLDASGVDALVAYLMTLR